MEQGNVTILCTRPIESALIEKAAHANITISVIPFIQVSTIHNIDLIQQLPQLSTSNASVIFTSQHAVEALVQALPAHIPIPQWNIYCLGGNTFTHVKKYWPYNNIKATARSAAALAEEIKENKPKEVLFFCGNKRLDELPEKLLQVNIKVTEFVVYTTYETPVMVPSIYDGILFFSPSAVNSFFSVNEIAKDTLLFAIGNTTASAIKQFSTNNIIISEFPGQAQLVDKAIDYFNNGGLPID